VEVSTQKAEKILVFLFLLFFVFGFEAVHFGFPFLPRLRWPSVNRVWNGSVQLFSVCGVAWCLRWLVRFRSERIPTDGQNGVGNRAEKTKHNTQHKKTKAGFLQFCALG
jgi:hypothetical protein